jgi:hypothetical protein
MGRSSLSQLVRRLTLTGLVGLLVSGGAQVASAHRTALAAVAAVPARATQEPDAAAELAAVVEEFAAELGAPLGADAALATASVPDAVAMGMAAALRSLLACHRITEVALPDVRAADDERSLAGAAWGEQLRACASDAEANFDVLAAALDSSAASEAVDLWPVLRFEPGVTNDTYVHDYVLLVDVHGNDGYFNNAGGNGIDLKRGPAGSGALIEEPARGCQRAADAVMGQECVLTAAALLDVNGNDSYGRLETPDIDRVCTADPLARRILVQGAGGVGVGLLRDERGSDSYTGKVLTTGAGHINGVGHLRDLGGNDDYLVIRIGEGAATVGGSGSLVDEAGNDTFSFYMPSPLDPAAPDLTPGAGGVVDDQGRCDRGARLTLGAGNLTGVGLLKNRGGNDSYTSSERGQGFGSSGGFGTFLDSGGGRDTYAGAPGRADDTTIVPSADSQGFFQDS